MAAIASFDWQAPFLLDDQLSEAEQMLRNGAAAFAADEFAPRIKAAATEPVIFRKKGAAKPLGVTLPEEFGRIGTSYVAHGHVARELERIDSGYRLMISVQSLLMIYHIFAYGSGLQRQWYLAKLACVEWIGCFDLTEPDAGSNLEGKTLKRSIPTRARTMSMPCFWVCADRPAGLLLFGLLIFIPSDQR